MAALLCQLQPRNHHLGNHGVCGKETQTSEVDVSLSMQSLKFRLRPTGVAFIHNSAGCVALPGPGPSNPGARAAFDAVDRITHPVSHSWHRGLAGVVIEPRRDMNIALCCSRFL